MELLHLSKYSSAFKEPATPALHGGCTIDSNAPLVSFSRHYPSNLNWVKKKIGDAGGPSPLESTRNHPQKLLINNMHTTGHFPEGDYCKSGCDIYRLRHDLHALPPKKLRKLLTTFTDGAHIFSCVEKICMSSPGDLEWLEDGFDPAFALFSKKRPWQVCRLNWGGSDSSAGFLGLRKFYQRFINPDVLHDGDQFLARDSGSGGSTNGGSYGGGGDGHGGDGGGLEQPGSDREGVPIITNLHASEQDMEEQDEVSAHGGMDITIDTVLSENKGSIPSASDKKDRLEALCSVPFHNLYVVLEQLGNAMSSESRTIAQEGKEKVVEGDTNNIPMWQYNAHYPVDEASQSHEHMMELQSELHDVDSVSVDECYTTNSIQESKDLLDKLSGLTLSSIEHPLLQGSSKAQNFSTLRDALPEQQSAGKQLQGGVDWLGHLACNLSTRQGGKQEVLDKENKIDDEKLKSMVNEAVVIALKQLSDTKGIPALTKQADTETLKRLQRDVFSELLKLRERLEKLDQMTSVSRSDGARSGKTNLKGEARAGTALVMLEDTSSRHSRGSLQQAGMQTGVEVRFTFETPFRERDLLITECVAGQGSTVGEGRALGGPISLGKVHYLAHINEDVSISFVPIGAQGMDVTDIINPMQDQGLTALSSQGPALFDHCKGSAIGATWSGSSIACSVAQFLSGWGNQTYSMAADSGENGLLCLSTLGQILLQPTERLIFSISGLNRFWPSPPLPSSMGLHWSEMGPLVIPKIQSLQTSRSTMSSEDSFLTHCNSLGSNWGMFESEYRLDPPESKGTSSLSLAVASEVEMGENVSLGAWAQVELGDGLLDSYKGNFQWAFNIAKRSEGRIDWGASIGGSRPDFWSTSTCEQEIYPGYMGGGIGDSYDPQLHLEAFLKFKCGKGFTLQPGLLYLLSRHSRTPAFLVRSSWLF